VATTDQIRLALPAEAEYGRLARITAAGLALRMGFSYAEIEDLRLAIDETLILLLQADDGSGVVTLVFDPSPEAIIIDATTTARESLTDTEALERFTSIVAPIVSNASVEAPSATVHLVVERHAGTGDA
jgi:hypothetical protein